MAARIKKGPGRSATKLSDVEKPQILVTRAEKIENFLFEWGRIAIPSVVFGFLAILYYAGILNKIGLGYSIGLVLLMAAPLAVAMIVVRGYFPAWARRITVAATVLYLFGTIFPFTNMVYPGKPDFSVDLTKEDGEKTTAAVQSGHYWVEVFGTSFSKVAGVRNERGRYSVSINDDRLQGEFTDQPATAGGNPADGMMISHMKALKLDDGPVKLRATRIDKAIAPAVTVTGYRMALPPAVYFVILSIVLAWAVFVDGWFRDQTWRWRLAPWVGISVVFLSVFYYTWEPARMPGTAVWSGVLGGIGGFLAGWILSMVFRFAIGKLRTKL